MNVTSRGAFLWMFSVVDNLLRGFTSDERNSNKSRYTRVALPEHPETFPILICDLKDASRKGHRVFALLSCSMLTT